MDIDVVHDFIYSEIGAVKPKNLTKAGRIKTASLNKLMELLRTVMTVSKTKKTLIFKRNLFTKGDVLESKKRLKQTKKRIMNFLTGRLTITGEELVLYVARTFRRERGFESEFQTSPSTSEVSEVEEPIEAGPAPEPAMEPLPQPEEEEIDRDAFVEAVRLQMEQTERDRLQLIENERAAEEERLAIIEQQKIIEEEDRKKNIRGGFSAIRYEIQRLEQLREEKRQQKELDDAAKAAAKAAEGGLNPEDVDKVVDLVAEDIEDVNDGVEVMDNILDVEGIPPEEEAQPDADVAKADNVELGEAVNDDSLINQDINNAAQAEQLEEVVDGNSVPEVVEEAIADIAEAAQIENALPKDVTVVQNYEDVAGDGGDLERAIIESKEEAAQADPRSIEERQQAILDGIIDQDRPTIVEVVPPKPLETPLESYYKTLETPNQTKIQFVKDVNMPQLSGTAYNRRYRVAITALDHLNSQIIQNSQYVATPDFVRRFNIITETFDDNTRLYTIGFLLNTPSHNTSLNYEVSAAYNKVIFNIVSDPSEEDPFNTIRAFREHAEPLPEGVWSKVRSSIKWSILKHLILGLIRPPFIPDYIFEELVTITLDILYNNFTSTDIKNTVLVELRRFFSFIGLDIDRYLKDDDGRPITPEQELEIRKKIAKEVEGKSVFEDLETAFPTAPLRHNTTRGVRNPSESIDRRLKSHPGQRLKIPLLSDVLKEVDDRETIKNELEKAKRLDEENKRLEEALAESMIEFRQSQAEHAALTAAQNADYRDSLRQGFRELINLGIRASAVAAGGMSSLKGYEIVKAVGQQMNNAVQSAFRESSGFGGGGGGMPGAGPGGEGNDPLAGFAGFGGGGGGMPDAVRNFGEIIARGGGVYIAALVQRLGLGGLTNFINDIIGNEFYFLPNMAGPVIASGLMGITFGVIANVLSYFTNFLPETKSSYDKRVKLIREDEESKRPVTTEFYKGDEKIVSNDDLTTPQLGPSSGWLRPEFSVGGVDYIDNLLSLTPADVENSDWANFSYVPAIDKNNAIEIDNFVNEMIRFSGDLYTPKYTPLKILPSKKSVIKTMNNMSDIYQLDQSFANKFDGAVTPYDNLSEILERDPFTTDWRSNILYHPDNSIL